MDAVFIPLSWLATFLVHSTVFLGGAWLITRFFFGDNPAARELIWKTAAVGSLATATLAFVAFPGLPVPSLFAESGDGEPVVAAVETFESSFDSQSGLALTGVPAATVTGISQADPVRYLISAAPSEAGAELQATLVGSTGGEVGSTRSSLLNLAVTQPAAAGLVLLWSCLSAFLLFRLHRRRRLFLARIGKRTAVLGGRMFEQLQYLATLYDIDDISLTRAPRLSGPAVLSAREICVPFEAFTELEAGEQRSLIAHEFAHVVRRDPTWLWAFQIGERILFFQPLLRLARRKYEQAAEELCDSWVVEKTGESDALASCLVRVARWVRGEPAVGYATMAGRPLRSRVERLLSGAASSGTLHPATFAVATLVVVLVGAWGPGIDVASRAEAQPVPSSASFRVSVIPSDLSEAPVVGTASVIALRSAPVTSEAARPNIEVSTSPAASPEVTVLGTARLDLVADTIVVAFSSTDQFVVSNGNVITTISGDGTVVLHRRGTVSRISNGGHFKIRRSDSHGERSVTAEPREDGGINYAYEEDGKTTNFGREPQEWFALEIRHFVETRMDRPLGLARGPRQTIRATTIDEERAVADLLSRREEMEHSLRDLQENLKSRTAALSSAPSLTRDYERALELYNRQRRDEVASLNVARAARLAATTSRMSEAHRRLEELTQRARVEAEEASTRAVEEAAAQRDLSEDERLALREEVARSVMSRYRGELEALRARAMAVEQEMQSSQEVARRQSAEAAAAFDVARRNLRVTERALNENQQRAQVRELEMYQAGQIEQLRAQIVEMQQEIEYLRQRVTRDEGSGENQD